jgi:creatinine amidohydrolase
MREVRLQWLRPDEIVAERERTSIVYLPVGPLEWHGPHLPMGTDPLLAEKIALELARQVGGVVHPTLYVGTERERPPELLQDLGFKGDEWIVGMDFPANNLDSCYYREDAFAVIVRLTLEQLVAQGYKFIVIVNGHGATNQIYHLQRLSAEFSQRGPSRVIYTFDLDGSVDEDAGHATITETAAVIALDPTRVELGSLPPADFKLRNTDFAIVDGETFMGQPTSDHTVRPKADPRHATIEIGQQFFSRAVARLKRLILQQTGFEETIEPELV